MAAAEYDDLVAVGDVSRYTGLVAAVGWPIACLERFDETRRLPLLGKHTRPALPPSRARAPASGVWSRGGITPMTRPTA